MITNANSKREKKRECDEENKKFLYYNCKILSTSGTKENFPN